MASLSQRGLIRRITKQSAQGCQGKGIKPYTIDSRSASRHHTDSLGASTAQEKGSAGPVHRRRDWVDIICNAVHQTSPGLRRRANIMYYVIMIKKCEGIYLAVREVLNIPQNLEVAAIIPFGYKAVGAKEIPQKEVSLESRLHIDKW